MKLIDLLVKELPKSGGWPDGVAAMAQDADGAVQNYRGTDDIRIDSQYAFGASRIIGGYSIAEDEVSAASDRLTAIVTRDQYEAALAASDDRLEQDLNECIGQSMIAEKSEAEFPEVGAEIEYSTYGQKAWYRGIVTAIGESMYIVKNLSGAEQAFHKFDVEFRPLRAEAEKAREKLAASLHSAAGASPIGLNGIGPLYFKLADAIISGSVFGTTFKADK